MKKRCFLCKHAGEYGIGGSCDWCHDHDEYERVSNCVLIIKFLVILLILGFACALLIS